jgi:CRP/FNR family transcriptional regulator, anaerobic regulatory protein
MKSTYTTPNAELAIEEILKKFGIKKEKVYYISKYLLPLHFKKGEIFSEYGKICNKIGILFSGLLYANYEIENSTQEIVSRFFFSPDNIVVTSFESFYYQLPSNESIKALEDSYLFCINRKDLSHLYNILPELNLIGRQIAEQSYIQALRRIHNLQAMNSQQRVNDFFEKQPELYNKIMKKHLTSYLGLNRNAVTKYLNPKKEYFATKIASSKKRTK